MDPPVDENISFTCTFCDYTANQKDILDSHSCSGHFDDEMMNELRPLTCDRCLITFNDLDAIFSHECGKTQQTTFVINDSDDDDTESYQSKPVNLNTLFTCFKCNYETGNLDELLYHSCEAHLQTLGWKCDKCDYQAQTVVTINCVNLI